MESEVLQNFIGEVEKSVLLDEADKFYWMTNAPTFPTSLIEYFLKILKEKNALIDNYIKKAIDANPELIVELKNKIRGIKQHVLKLQEKSDTKPEEVEAYLKTALKDF